MTSPGGPWLFSNSQKLHIDLLRTPSNFGLGWENNPRRCIGIIASNLPR